MSFQEQGHALPQSHDTTPILNSSLCPYTPLLESADANAAADAPLRQRRRRRTSSVVLLLLTGLLGGAIFVAVVLLKNGNNEPNEEMAVPLVNAVPVGRGVAEGVSSKSFRPLLRAPVFAWTAKMLAWHRTAFHFQPRKNWMN
ncbi:hypothetical protein MIMGU_mgv1a0026272mg, partial [Erythranthe guttata]